MIRKLALALASTMLVGCAFIKDITPPTVYMAEGVGETHTVYNGKRDSYTTLSFNHPIQCVYTNNAYYDGIPSASNQMFITYGRKPRSAAEKDTTIYLIGAWNGNGKDDSPKGGYGNECPWFRTNLQINASEFQTAIKRKYAISNTTNFNRMVVSNGGNNLTYKSKDDSGNWLNPNWSDFLGCLNKGIGYLNSETMGLMIMYLSCPMIETTNNTMVAVDNNGQILDSDSFTKSLESIEKGRMWIVIDTDYAKSSFESLIPTNKNIMVWYSSATNKIEQAQNIRGTDFTYRFLTAVNSDRGISYKNAFSNFMSNSTNSPIMSVSGTWMEKPNATDEEMFK